MRQRGGHGPVPTEPCAGAPRCEPIGTNRGASQGKVGCGGRLFDYPYRQVLPLANQCITDMGGQQGLEPMIRLTTDHHRTTMARVCRFENVKDDILGVDRVHNCVSTMSSGTRALWRICFARVNTGSAACATASIQPAYSVLRHVSSRSSCCGSSEPPNSRSSRGSGGKACNRHIRKPSHPLMMFPT
jgi:hypothetical protein